MQFFLDLEKKENGSPMKVSSTLELTRKIIRVYYNLWVLLKSRVRPFRSTIVARLNLHNKRNYLQSKSNFSTKSILFK